MGRVGVVWAAVVTVPVGVICLGLPPPQRVRAARCAWEPVSGYDGSSWLDLTATGQQREFPLLARFRCRPLALACVDVRTDRPGRGRILAG